MENASDALIMAGQILIFIVALTGCITSFSTVRSGVDNIISETDTVKFARGEEGYINYIQSDQNKAIRKVGIETVVSSMYRASKENYEIYIKLFDLSSINSLPDDETKVEFYEAEQDLTLKLGDVEKTPIHAHDNLIKIGIGIGKNQNINTKLRSGLYERISDLSFYEYFGQYQNNNEVGENDKTTYRIVTYIDSRCF